AVAERARHLGRLDALVDLVVLLQPGQPLVRGRLEAEEDVEQLGDRPPRLEQLRVAGDEVGAALYQDPALLHAAAAQRVGQLEAARGVVPEEAVGDEDVGPGGGKVLDDGADAALAEAAIIELPHRAERAAERAAAGGLDEPHRAEVE